MKNGSLVILLWLILFSCNDYKEFTLTKRGSTEYVSVDIQQILEDPSQFDGKYIETSGILVNEFENIGIYKSRTDANRKDFNNALWADFEEELLTEEELEKIKKSLFVDW